MRKLFSRSNKKSKNQPPFNILDVEYAELNQFEDVIDRIRGRKVDGIIVRNVFSDSEVQNLSDNFKSLQHKEKQEVTEGLVMFPRPFASVEQSTADLNEGAVEYHENCAQINRDFQEIFKVDFEGRIKALLQSLGGGRNAIIPNGIENTGSYPPATFKHLLPGKGTLKPHCGNLFHKEFPKVFSHLGSLSVIHNQLSYFVVLDKVDQGGELVMYNIDWKNTEVRLPGDKILKDKKGNEHHLDDHKKVQQINISPNPGDLYLFAGGEIWHKVALVEGEKARLTISGFITPSKDDKTLFFWS